MVRSIFFAVINFYLILSFAFAFEFNARVENDHIANNQVIVLKLELLDASPNNSPNISVLKNDFIISGVSQSSRTSIINGIRSVTNIWIYRLLPRKEGNVIIPSIEIDSNKGKIATREIPITVDPAINGNISNSFNKNNSVDASNNQSSLKLEAHVSNKSPYKNEPIIYTLKFTSNVYVENLNIEYLNLKDAIIDVIGEPEILNERAKDNKVSITAVIKYRIIPLREGKFLIPSIKINGNIVNRTKNIHNSFFTGFNSRFFNDLDDFLNEGDVVPFSLTSDEISIDVKQAISSINPWICANSLKIDRKIAKKSNFILGEPVNLTIAIKAENLHANHLPSLELQHKQSENYRIYGENPKLKNTNSGEMIISERVEEYTLIPQKTGNITIPAMEIKWWNIKENKINIISVPEQIITVADEIDNKENSDIDGNIKNKQENSSIVIPEKNLEINLPVSNKIINYFLTENKSINWPYVIILSLVIILFIVIILLVNIYNRLKKGVNYNSGDHKKLNNKKIFKKSAIFSTDYIYKTEISRIKSPEDVRKFLYSYVKNYFKISDINENTPFEFLIDIMQDKYLHKEKDILDKMRSILQNSLYAGKEVDIEELKGYCLIIVQKSNKDLLKNKENNDLDYLNPS